MKDKKINVYFEKQFLARKGSIKVQDMAGYVTLFDAKDIPLEKFDAMLAEVKAKYPTASYCEMIY